MTNNTTETITFDNGEQLHFTRVDMGTHQWYTRRDFTQEEIDRDNVIAVAVIKNKEQHCKCCGYSTTDFQDNNPLHVDFGVYGRTMESLLIRSQRECFAHRQFQKLTPFPKVPAPLIVPNIAVPPDVEWFSLGDR